MGISREERMEIEREEQKEDEYWENRKSMCKECGGEGWTSEHDMSPGSHDEFGGCVGWCPVQVHCGYCEGRGYIHESK